MLGVVNLQIPSVMLTVLGDFSRSSRQIMQTNSSVGVVIGFVISYRAMSGVSDLLIVKR